MKPEFSVPVACMLICILVVLAKPSDAVSETQAPKISSGTSSAITLTDEELQKLRSNVLRRCAVSSKLDKNKLPWYFHYEFGVALLEAGDANRGLEALRIGANLKEWPMRDKRMYGMWYIDYLPYYQIARAHSVLGNWESAGEALDLSEQLERITNADFDYSRYSELKSQVTRHVTEKETDD